MMKLSISLFVKIGLGVAILLAVAALLPNSPVITATTELDRHSWRRRHSDRILGIPVSQRIHDTFISRHASASGAHADWVVISRRSLGNTLRYKQMGNRLLSAMHHAEHFCQEHGIESSAIAAICRNAKDVGNNHSHHTAAEYLRRLDSMHGEWTTLSNLLSTATATNLVDMVIARSGLPVEDIGSSVQNPLISMPVGIQLDSASARPHMLRLSRLPALQVSASLTGTRRTLLVSTNQDLLLVLSPDFKSHDSVYAAGPVLVERGASVSRMVVSADTVFMVKRPTVMDGAIGFPVFIGWTPKPDHPVSWRIAGSGLHYRGEPQERTEAKLREPWFDPKVMKEQGYIRITEED
ncbi:MAG: hypothetical protein HN919_14185 [Verrucomicrobia bacterium]|nr:hypothetical protein [Verrucomicrobiota bacterium]